MTFRLITPSLTATALLALSVPVLLAQEAASGEAATEQPADDVMATQEATTGDAMATEPAADAATGDAAMTADVGAVMSPPEMPNADMQAVLDKLAELGAKPIEE